MPAKTSRRHRQGIESRERILQAALDVSRERGYAGLTIGAISKRAGLPSSSVFWHFQSKDDLIAEALEAGYAGLPSDLTTWEQGFGGRDAYEQIAARLALSVAHITDPSTFWRLSLMVSLQENPEGNAAREAVKHYREDYLTGLTAWLRRILPPAAAEQRVLVRHLAQGYLALVDGLFISRSADPSMDLAPIADLVPTAMAQLVEQWSRDPKHTVARLTRANRALAGKSLPAGAFGSDDVKERLLMATSHLALERGYRGTSVANVCQLARVQVNNLYWHFTNKDGVFLAAVERAWAEWRVQPQVPHAAWGTADADEELRRCLQSAAHAISDRPGFVGLGDVLALEHEPGEVAARDAVAEHRLVLLEEWWAWFTGSARTASDPRLPQTLARIVMALQDGFLVSARIDAPRPTAGGFAEFTTDLLHALARP